MTSKRLLIGIQGILIGFCLSSLAAAETFVIPTLGGAALVPTVQAQLDQLPQGGTVSVYQDKLVLMTTPANYRAVQALLAQIDQPSTLLEVSLRVGDTQAQQARDANVQIGASTIGRQVWVNGQWQHSASHSQNQQHFRVTTQSGKPADIHLSQLMMLPSIGSMWNSPTYAPILWIGHTPLTASQGMRVLPTLLANGHVELQISQTNQQLANVQGQVARTGQTLATTVTIPRGQWTTLGVIRQQNSQQSPHHYATVNQQLPVQIMVR